MRIRCIRQAFASLLVVAAGALAGGCAAAPLDEEVGTGSESALSLANAEFSSELREVARLKARCDSEGKCSRASELAVQGVRPVLGTLDAPVVADKRITDFTLCETIRPLAALESPYFFVGASATAAYVGTIADAGADLVFDLRNKQVAMFHYEQHGLQNLVGAEAKVYAGYAFGKKPNVLAAWSGEFQGASATVETPFLKLAAGGAIFRAPDNSLWGALIEASIGFNVIPTAVEVSVSEGHWTPWDSATAAFGDGLWFVAYTEQRAEAAGHSHKYLQLKNAGHTALALLETFGPIGAIPAVQVLALDALRSKGLTIDAACP